MRDRVSVRRASAAFAIAGCFSLLAACGNPVTVRTADPHDAYQTRAASALSTGEPSEMTRTSLRSKGLLTRWDEDPVGTMRALHEIVVDGRGGRRDVFALAELSLIYAEAKHSRPYSFAAAVYAWAFLFPEGADRSPSRFDDRTRIATEIYNRAIVGAFRHKYSKDLDLSGGLYSLPFGQIEVRMKPDALVWDGRQLIDIEPLSDLEVGGLLNEYRLSGLGAPLGARAVLEGEEAKGDLVAPRVRLPITALLRIQDARRALAGERIRSDLEVYTQSDAETVTIGEEEVPLQYEQTAALAKSLHDAPFWEHEIWGFFGRAASGEEFPLLRAGTPHRKGAIPVVFVHGTASSPGRWADMLNDLWSQSWIREHYEPWLFMYDTGYPIAYSAMLLREKLHEAVQRLESTQGYDPCLHQMVLIGHSQGGLLVKLAVIDSGDQLWNSIARKPLDDLPISDDGRTLLRESLFVKPVPEVTRAVFVATPHRGSFQAGRSIASWITRFIRMPRRLLNLAKDFVTLNTDAFVQATSVSGVPTSIDNMNPNSPFLKGLVDIPLAPGVTGHSIIAVDGDGPIERGNDGVVEYSSAHIDGVASELVVESTHSCQPMPATIEEMRRILAVHAEAVEAAGLHCGQ